MKTARKFLSLITKPSRFFAAILLEQKIGWAVFFVFVIALSICIARVFVEGLLSLPSTSSTLAQMVPTAALIGVAYCCIYAFGASQLGKKFGGKATFKRVFIVGAYSLFPAILFVFPQTALIGLIWSFALAVIGLRVAHGLPLVRAIIVQAVMVAVIALFGALGTMALMQIMQRHYSSENLVHKPAPDVSIHPFDGEPISLSSLKGKSVVVLDFWATWCSPCRSSLPLLAQVARDYRDRGVVVFAVSDDDDWQTAKKYLQDSKIDLVGAKGSRQLDQAFFVEALPETVIVDKNGTVHWVHVGASMQENEHLRAELDRCLSP